MTSTQKAIAVLGILAIALTTRYAPYDVVGFDEVSRVIDREGPADRWKYRVQAIVHAPLWAAPTKKDAELMVYKQDTARLSPTVESVELAAGRMMLWWVGIAALTGAAIVLAASARREQDSEAERPGASRE
jgi:hypothetical protein